MDGVAQRNLFETRPEIAPAHQAEDLKQQRELLAEDYSEIAMKRCAGSEPYPADTAPNGRK